MGRRPRVHLRGNRRYLRRGGNHYIIGEKLRSGSAEAQAALSRQRRYKDVAGNLKVKEVRIAEDERFVICHNPEAAERDAAIRARMITQLKELIDGSDKLSRDKRAELRGVISTRPGLNLYLRATPGGLLRIDASRARAEALTSFCARLYGRRSARNRALKAVGCAQRDIGPQAAVGAAGQDTES